MSLSHDERDELRATTRRLLEQHCAPEAVRRMTSGTPGYDRVLWGRMVDLGWTSLHVPEALGGAGCGWADIAVVAQELGRAITPSPFLASAVLATGALLGAENHVLGAELVAAFAAGERIGTVAFAADRGSYDIRELTTSWESVDGSIRLRGSAGCVLDADLADVLVVGAVDAGGEAAVVAVERSTPGVVVEHRPTADRTRRLFTVRFDDVGLGRDRLLCEPGAAAAALLDKVLALGTVAAAADATGVAGKVLDVTARYATERMQFGKPIGSFQGVKHHCANMAIAVEAGRAASLGAAAALDGDPADWGVAAAVAASYVGPACSEAAALGLRVHGGIGFTWEHDAHLYLKRAKLDEVLFGTPSWHRRRLADRVFPARTPSP